MQEESCYSATFTIPFIQLPDDAVQVSFVEEKHGELIKKQILYKTLNQSSWFCSKALLSMV